MTVVCGIKVCCLKQSKMEPFNFQMMVTCIQIVKASYVLLGDDAFALKRYMMKPYPQQNLTLDKRIYNYRHSRARRISENLFGILANRWRVYHTKILLHPDRMNSLILTTLALHNMLRKSPGSRNLYSPSTLADSLDENGIVIEGEWRSQECSNVLYPYKHLQEVTTPQLVLKMPETILRTTLCVKVLCEGAVDWQWDKC